MISSTLSPVRNGAGLKFVSLTAVCSILVACGGNTEPQAEPVEGIIPGLEISNARMLLAPVSGNPAAVYFDVEYNGERGLSISGAEVEGAESATVHDMMEYNFEMTMSEASPVPMTKGTKVAFEPGGKHVMAFGLDESIAPGTTAEVTLKISGGKTHKFDAEVRSAGDER
ncbi:MAG: copper chaperone PCu(A)C [Pseudomonadota bacterium]